MPIEKTEFKKLFSEAFDPYMASIAKEFVKLSKDIGRVEKEVAKLSNRIARLELEISDIKIEIKEIKQEIAEIKMTLATFREKQDVEWDEIKKIESRIERLEEVVFK